MTPAHKDALAQLVPILVELQQFKAAQFALQAINQFIYWASQSQYCSFTPDKHLLWLPLHSLVMSFPDRFFPVFIPRLILSSPFWAEYMPTMTIATRSTIIPDLPIPYRLYSSPYLLPNTKLLAPMFNMPARAIKNATQKTLAQRDPAPHPSIR
jgi:hypothetical protein